LSAARAADASALRASDTAADARCRATAASSPLFCLCSVESIACRTRDRQSLASNLVSAAASLAVLYCDALRTFQTAARLSHRGLKLQCLDPRATSRQHCEALGRYKQDPFPLTHATLFPSHSRHIRALVLGPQLRLCTESHGGALMQTHARGSRRSPTGTRWIRLACSQSQATLLHMGDVGILPAYPAGNGQQHFRRASPLTCISDTVLWGAPAAAVMASRFAASRSCLAACSAATTSARRASQCASCARVCCACSTCE